MIVFGVSLAYVWLRSSSLQTNSERGVATEPPPVIQFSATVTQWEIYDTYMADYKHMLEEVSVRVLASASYPGSRCLNH
jgi:hypothetical protein